MIDAHDLARALYSFVTERLTLNHFHSEKARKREDPGIASVGRFVLAIAALCFADRALISQSVFTLRPEDPHAVYLAAQSFGAHGNGVDDDSDALQHAIDRVQETTHQGIVFIPEGRYLLHSTIHVWSGIRLVGYGAKRPVLLLGLHSPGFQKGPDRYMLWFTDERPQNGQSVADASEFTFYSAVSNVDFALGDGNPAAVAIRFNVAQHSFISHCNFRLGNARAAIEAVGNQASDIHIFGGEYGIITGKTSPAWQFLLMDSSFEGQRIAAIRTHEAGFTLVRDRFANVPIAIEIPKGQVEQLYGRDLRLQHISRAALVLGDVQNLRSEVNLENVACEDVPRFIEGAQPLRELKPMRLPSRFFVEDRFAVGLDIDRSGREKGVALHHHEHILDHASAIVSSDIPSLPDMSSWVNVQTLGIKGDGGTDDTTAMQRAIDDHAALYFPSGMYRLTGSLRLRRETVLIGFSPITTQLTIIDSEADFRGDGPPIPLLIAPPGGTNIVTGLGISTGNNNPRAVGVEWLAGSRSMLDDVSFMRGHSAYVPLLAPAAFPQASLASRAPMQLDQQYAALWIHTGGGGILRGIWSHGGTAKSGLLIEDTSTPGSIYQFSCEHHLQNEVRLRHVENWKFYDLQTEEENPEGAEAVAVEIDSSHHLLFANTYMYRVSRNVMPKLYAVVARDSSEIAFDNVKVFSQTRLAFDNSVFDQDRDIAVRSHNFTQFVLNDEVRRGAPLPRLSIFVPEASLERVATGFSNASSLTADQAGTVYFSDAAMHSIYLWDGSQRVAARLAKVPSDPMVMGFVAPGTLLVVNSDKSVSNVQITTGSVTPVSEHEAPFPNTVYFLPVGLHNELSTLQLMLEHRGYIFRVGSNTALRSGLLPEHRGYFYAPDEQTALMAGGTWRPILQSSQLAAFAPGLSHYIVSEDDARTYTAERSQGETLTIKLFTERGGTSVVSDVDGNVYIADGQVYVYDRNGHQSGVLEVPERPGSLCFGGADHRTLFIGARASLYAIKTQAAGK